MAAASLVLASAACGGAPGAPNALPTPSPTPPPPKVVIVSVDGLRPDAISLANAQNMLGLAQRGAYTWKAQTVYPSTTLPGHISMLSGVDPSVHGITFDDYRQDVALKVPTLFATVKAAGMRTVLVAGKPKFQQLFNAETLDAFLVANGDAGVVDQAISLVATEPRLMFVHLPDTDVAGHRYGWLSDQYLAKVSAADAALGRLLAALPPETTVIFTADHGGQGTEHGSRQGPDVTIPWIIAGPRIHPGAITRTVRTMDTAATALRVLGLELSPAVVGVCSPAFPAGAVIAEAFQ